MYGNSKSSALSQLLTDHTPKVTLLAAAKRSKLDYLQMYDAGSEHLKENWLHFYGKNLNLKI